MDICKELTGKASTEFSSTQEINIFMEKKEGHALPERVVYPDVVGFKGAVFPVKELDADCIFEEALAQ